MSSDLASFGLTVRSRRQRLGLSQEALAAAALGNPDRKSYISAIENNRLPKITPETARRLAGALDMAASDVPPALWWPEMHQDVAGRRDDIAIAINDHLRAVYEQSTLEIYLSRLSKGLAVLRIWIGEPFRIQSLGIVLALAFCYVILAGLASFIVSDIQIGSVQLFVHPSWVPESLRTLVALVAILLTMGGGIACLRVLKRVGMPGMPFPAQAVRVVAAAGIAGIACSALPFLGVNELTVALLFAVVCFFAVSRLPPHAAGLAGLVGGLIAWSMVEVPILMAGATASNVWERLSVGLIVGGLSGWCSGAVALRIRHPVASAMAGAGIGVSVGAVCITGVFGLAHMVEPMETDTVGLIAVMWLAIPLANGIADFLSLGVSQWLGERVVAAPARLGRIVWIGVLDLLAAILLACITLVTIIMALALAQHAFALDFSARLFVANSLAEPWSAGLWLTVMVLSTLWWSLANWVLAVTPSLAAWIVVHLVEMPIQARLSKTKRQIDVMALGFLPMRHGMAVVIWGGLALLPLAGLTWLPGLLRALFEALPL